MSLAPACLRWNDGALAGEPNPTTFLHPIPSVIDSWMDESPSDLLAFEPVASASKRHDGWTPEKQNRFIQELARLGLVSAAARAVGMSPKSAYALLKRAPEESGFARAWDAALDEGEKRARCEAIDRALNGVEVPYFYRGLQRGTRRVYNDRLIIAALNAAMRRKGAS